MPGETYLSAGVDLQLMDDVIHRAKAFARTTHGPVVEGSSEGFAGLYRLEGFKAPIMVASADGVGTKLKIASLLGHWEGLGIDLVNLNVNDVLTWGARPLFFLDYISLSSLEAPVVETLLRGMAWACRLVGCALIGGETAQMPGMYREGDLDLAGFLVGAVEENELLGSSRVQEGDVLLGLPSSGLHTNGLSLVRRVFDVDSNPAVLYQHFDELSHTLGEELLIPHRCYYPLLAPVFPLINAMVHVTGGGLHAKMPVNLPLGMAVRFEEIDSATAKHLKSYVKHKLADLEV